MGQRLITLLNFNPDTKKWAVEQQISPGDLLDMIKDDREALDGHNAARYLYIRPQRCRSSSFPRIPQPSVAVIGES